MYSEIDFWRFALGAGIVSVPMFFLEQQSRGWAMGYAILILLGFAVFNFKGLERSSAFASRELRGKG